MFADICLLVIAESSVHLFLSSQWLNSISRYGMIYYEVVNTTHSSEVDVV